MGRRQFRELGNRGCEETKQVAHCPIFEQKLNLDDLCARARLCSVCCVPGSGMKSSEL